MVVAVLKFNRFTCFSKHLSWAWLSIVSYAQTSRIVNIQTTDRIAITHHPPPIKLRKNTFFISLTFIRQYSLYVQINVDTMGTHWRFVWAQEYPVAVNDETFTARTKLTGTRKIETQYEPKRKNSLLSKHLKHGFKTLRRFLYVILQRETIPFWWTKNQPKRKQLTSRISCIHTAFIGGATSPFPYQILKRACHFACVLSNDLLSFHARSLSLFPHTHTYALSFALVLAPAFILLLCYISLCRWSLSWFHLSRQVSLRSFNRSQCSTVINRVMCVCVYCYVYITELVCATNAWSTHIRSGLISMENLVWKRVNSCERGRTRMISAL